MNPQRMRAALYGAIAGAALAIGFLAVAGSLTTLESVSPVILDYTTERARPMFVVSSGALFLLYIVLGLIGGLVITGIAYAFGREAEPDSPKFPLTWLLPTGAIVATIMAYATLRSGIAAAGDIRMGMVTISVFRMTVVAALSGAVGGGFTAGVVDTLARPAVLGLEGEAWPSTPRAMLGEMVRAVGVPTVAVVVAAVFAIGLSQVLLALEGVGAIAAFSVVGAIVLGGATLIALRPWDRSSPQG